MQKRSVQTVRAGRQDAARFAYGKNRRSVLSWMRRIACRRQAARGENKSGSAAKYGRAVKKIETEAMMINGELKRPGSYDVPYSAEIKGGEKTAVIVVHGFASSKESPTVKMLMENLPKHGIAVIAFDFPAHGVSPVNGDFLTVENCTADLADMEKHVRELLPEAEIGYFGSSFGAYITLIYLMERDAEGTKAFLRSAAVNMSEYFLELTAEERAALDEHGYFMLDDSVRPVKITAGFIEDLKDHDIMERFERKGQELLMIHGSEDEDIAYDRAKAFAEKYDIDLVTIDGGDHRLSIPGAPERVLSEAVGFFGGDQETR